MSNVILSNIVDDTALRKVQLSTLEKVNEVVSKTSGPYGSATMIMHNDRFTEYSKDGHKVLNNIKFFRPLEQSVHDELLSITEHVVRTVGDGTTTAVQLSYNIFKRLVEEFENSEVPAHAIINTFQIVVNEIREEILKNGRDLTVDDIFNICMISTNGNRLVSQDIADIYKKFGTTVHIQLGTSNTESSVLKVYDGVVFNRGFASPAFINTGKNTVYIRNPRIYHFVDPVDTPEMISLFMNIFMKNIYEPYQKREEYTPTVILVPSISQDVKSDLEDIEKIFYAFDQTNTKDSKPPFCIISGINEAVDNITDIIQLCGCKSIRKFINPDVQKKAVEEGTAPSVDNVTEFYGSCDSIEIDMAKTKIINPVEMFDNTVEPDEEGNRPFSNTYKSLINFYENQIRQEEETKEDINLLGNMKRKLNFLKANFVEYLIGGISVADRDNVKDLVEDAILNCRSAALNGVGYGAYFEGLRASAELYKNITDKDSRNAEMSELYTTIVEIIVHSYNKMAESLYRCVSSNPSEIVSLCIEKNRPLNIRTNSFDDEPVLCSIETDRAILDAISKIITIMYTANQALLVDATQNLYLNLEDNK